MDIKEKEQKELHYWKISPYESPENFSLQSIVYKLSEARIFFHKLNTYKVYFDKYSSFFEVGSGQGWTSCLLKSLYPEKKVIASDMSPMAIDLMRFWEDFLKVSLDQKIVCKSYELPLEDESVDLIFAFQSAHHFGEHQKTLSEMYRVLKKGGTVLYLHEPSCRKFMYPLAYKRVNNKRPSVPEDVLVYTDMVAFARQVGFQTVETHFDPTLIMRGPLETLYYYFLQKFSFLQKVLPCTVDYVMKK